MRQTEIHRYVGCLFVQQMPIAAEILQSAVTQTRQRLAGLGRRDGAVVVADQHAYRAA